MPRWVSRVVIVVVLPICVWGHLSEIADRWDHTLQSGVDSEYTLTLLALTAGTVVAIATRFVAKRLHFCQAVLAPVHVLTPSGETLGRIPIPDSSPPLSLRI